MYCSKCGAQIDDSATFCQYCGTPTTGTPVNQQYYAPPVQQGTNGTSSNQTNGFAIAGFVLAFFMPLIGLVLSIVGLVKSKKDFGGSGKGLAIAGIVISGVAILIYIIVFASFASVLGAVAG